jgi:ankyrin repeat protein
VNSRDHQNRTPLHAAADGDHPRVIALLVARGANINAKASFSGRTALDEAVLGSRLSACRELLELGAEADFNSLIRQVKAEMSMAPLAPKEQKRKWLDIISALAEHREMRAEAPVEGD